MAIQIDGDSGVSGVNGSATTPALQGTDSNTGIVFGTDEVQVATGGSTRATVDSSGRLLVGTSSAIDTYPVFQIKGYAGDTTGAGWMGISSGNSTPSNNENMGLFSYLNAAGGEAARIECEADAAHTGSSAQGRLAFMTTASGDVSPTERVRIDSSGRVGIGETSPSHKCQIAGTLAVDSYNDTTKTITLRPGYEANANGGMGLVAKDHSGSAADGLGVYGTDGISLHTANAGTFYERMRIDNSGNITNKSSNIASITGSGFTFGPESNAFIACTRTNDTVYFANREGTDGTLVDFYHAGNNEGSISVSGTTVSYNGGHLTRWSQLAGGAERTEILRGSVLSNLDEMCEWAHAAQDAVLYTEEDELPEGVSVGDVKTPAVEAYTEDNEQLNRMKVSDVEGDVNVAGVFQAWDDDDDTYDNDFYCAMTGDFIIRIAQGTTVARGDLLMSAGDGTAKPQDDDIVRSKTIAKVTSTTVSTTYSDGSYCVPCVLMAC